MNLGMERPVSRNDSQGKVGNGYIVGSGWWCSDVDDTEVNPSRKRLGSNLQREAGFFKLWLDGISRVSSPSEIVVVDSASPIKPDDSLREKVAWIELPFNARHSTDHLGRWSGWTRSVLLAGSYAMTVGCDYFVYVEQDCLLKGPGIIETCIAEMKTGLMFGDGQGTPQPLQQSFFIVRGDRLPSFLRNLVDIVPIDSDMSPEWKFFCASWRPLVIAANLGFFRSRRFRKYAFRFTRRFLFDFLPVGCGRVRPIPFDDDFYYFQHGTQEEIEKHLGSRCQ